MKLFRAVVICILPILSMTKVGICQKDDMEPFKKDAKQYFDKTLQTLGIPGFAVVVTKGDKTLIAEGYGYADVESQLIANSQTAYYIASATKSFTALLAVMLDDAGILKLDDPLQKYFPEVVVDSNLDLAHIKIRDLLTHTAGLENNPIGWRVAYSGEHNPSTLLALMKYTKPNEVGYGHYEYSNIGYNIYAIILEKITGKSWQNWMQEKIFEPIGMHHSTAFISRAEKEKWVLAKPYLVIDSLSRIGLEKKDNTMQSAGGLIMTPDDMAKWLKIQVGKGTLNGKQIFPESMIIASQQVLVQIPASARVFQPTHYGYGWLHGTYETHQVIHHFGGFAGFATHVSFMPDKQIGVAIMVNEALAGDKLMNLIATFIYDFFLGTKDWSDFDKTINSFAEKLTEGRKMMSSGIVERNTRPWMLTMPLAAYAGSYQSDEYGIIKILESPSGIQVAAGNLLCVATPFIKEETIRIELIPGSGQLIEFQKENNTISGLKYDGIIFTKIE